MTQRRAAVYTALGPEWDGLRDVDLLTVPCKQSHDCPQGPRIDQGVHMKTACVALVAAVMLQATPAFSASTATSPLVGTWLLDTSSLPMPAAVRPKRVVLEFKQVPGNKWATSAEIIEHDNNKLEAQSTLLLDGTPGKASGTYLVDRAAVKMPEPGVLVMQLMYQGVPASTRTYTVSANGKVMTEIEAYFKDGNPMMRTAYFKRAQSQTK
ncbi:hypothetical protein GGR61_003784 [Xanthomonas arboricola]|nr:hypothetical protein [Xanthomonas sp. 3075]MBB5866109.1 hypothetical protein [Xanthomonas sp. 3058]